MQLPAYNMLLWSGFAGTHGVWGMGGDGSVNFTRGLA
jgi:hypothetical protein